jgi:CelD/BcsL family acetyltransferase involved in cellulose biosynthesis
LETQVIREPAGALHVAAEWDRLAVTSGRPYAAPGWQLGWWDAARPEGGRPVILVARDAGSVAGVLALWAQRTRSGVERLRVMGAPLAQGAGPVALPGREAAVAAAFATALHGLRPRPATLEFEGVHDGRRWAGLLKDTWPGRSAPRWRGERLVAAPLADLRPGTLDDWFAGRSSGFRQQMRRSRRALEARGATFSRAATPEAIEAAIPDLLRLHHGRWDARGGSKVVDGRTGAALAAVARRLGGEGGRMHIELIELDGQVISAHLFVAAGAETTYWLGGFDDAHARDRPGLVALVGGVEHALARGATCFDLGPGRRPYKARFADRERLLDWGTLLLPGPQRPFTTMRLVPGRLARQAAHRVRKEAPDARPAGAGANEPA